MHAVASESVVSFPLPLATQFSTRPVLRVLDDCLSMRLTFIHIFYMGPMRVKVQSTSSAQFHKVLPQPFNHLDMPHRGGLALGGIASQVHA